MHAAPHHPPQPPPPMTGVTARCSSYKIAAMEQKRHEEEEVPERGRGRVGAGSDGINGDRERGRGVETSMLVSSRGDDSVRGIDQYWDPSSAVLANVARCRERESDPAPDRRRRGQRQSFTAATLQRSSVARGVAHVGYFWRGFALPLILACISAIRFTASDVLEALWLWLRQRVAAAASVTGTDDLGSEWERGLSRVEQPYEGREGVGRFRGLLLRLRRSCTRKQRSSRTPVSSPRLC